MSRAQTIRWPFRSAAWRWRILFLLLPFRVVIDFSWPGSVADLGGIGERYFRRHATQAEIRADLEDRKNSPG